MRISVLLPLFFLLALSSLLPGALGQSDEGSRVLAALGSGAKAPILNAYFPSDPTSLVQATALNYTWLQSDPADNASVAAYHQGLVSLSGGPNAYIDLNTAYGGNSVGLVLPPIGGPGSGSGASQGWTVELVVKLTGSSGGWSKLVDFGDGPFPSVDGSYPTLNDLTITWDGNDNNENGLLEGLAVQQLSSPPPATLYNFAVVPIIKPVLGVWYHIVLVMQAVNVSAASATWLVYLNGALLPYSTQLQAGASLTAFQGANLPLPVVRNQSFIGKSDYGDPDLSAIFDAVRVYDYALSQTQVSALAAAYNLNTGVFLPQPSNDQPLPSSSETTYWQNAGISRAPVLNAVFPSDPSSVIGTTRLYQWAASDPSDSSSVQALHQGVLLLTNATNNFVDLTTPTGGNSVGLVMGVFGGPGGSTGAAMGWTVEMVVKPLATTPYTQLLTIGNGGYLDVLFVGWNAVGQLYVEQTSNVNVNLPGVIGQTDLTINASIPLGQWMHLALVLQPTNMAVYAGSMSVYLNGQLVLSSSDPTLVNYPVPVYRDQTYIAASDYNNPNAVATYDAVRVYDQALTQTQVQAMAQQYGLYAGGSSGQSDEGSRVLAALGSGAKAPILNAYFPSDPTSLVQATALNYTWLQSDPADNASVAAYHQGLVSLSGGPNAYIDLNTAYGGNSVGLVLPPIGGPGSGSGASQGWTVELVVKLTGSSGGWSKLVDFGDGPFPSVDGSYPTLNDLTITWDGNDNNENGLLEGLAVQQLSSPPPATLYNFAVVPIIKPVLGVWYHIVLVMQAVNVSAASATWLVYLNGALLPYSTQLQAGASLTAFQGANLPLPVVRNQSFIGKSDYGDPDLSAIFDAVRVYDYALSQTQVSALAAAYNLNTGVFLPQPSNDQPLPSSSETTYWQNAGISRAPVLNAVFPSDPSSVIGTTRLYQWAASDPSDSSSVQALHQGVLLLTNATNNFVDLTTPTGGNSVGLVMGVFGGPGGSTGAAMGWTVEMVVKPLATTPYTQLLTIGNGGYLDVLFVGWNAVGQLYVEQTSNVNVNLPGVIGQTDLTINASIPLGQWMHLALVLQPTNMAVYAGSMSVYLNGQLVLSSSDPTLVNYPVPVYRDQTYIAASDYNNPNAVATYDAVRVYDQALTQTQVQAMAQQYGLYAGGSSGQSDEGSRVLAALGSGAKAPILNAYFPSDPTSLVQATALNYTWLQSDPADNASVAAYHQGLVSLSGGPNAYIDLNTAYGGNSVGLVLPPIGGPGSGSGASQGWTVELVVKLTGSSGGWSKLVDFGDGPFPSVDGSYPTLNDLTITWDGNDNNENGLLEGLAVQQLSSPPPATLYNFAVVPIIKPVLGVWYHIVLVMQAVNVSAASATWLVYLNGALLPYSTQLQAGASLTAFQGANLPLPVVRNQSFIGKSDYGDPDLSAIFDAVRVYDYALSQTQVSALAAAYNLNTGVFLPQPSNDQPLPSSSETTYWQNAGISRAPVLNAVFPSDPSSVIGTTRLYQWAAVRPVRLLVSSGAAPGRAAADQRHQQLRRPDHAHGRQQRRAGHGRVRRPGRQHRGGHGLDSGDGGQAVGHHALHSAADHRQRRLPGRPVRGLERGRAAVRGADLQRQRQPARRHRPDGPDHQCEHPSRPVDAPRPGAAAHQHGRVRGLNERVPERAAGAEQQRPHAGQLPCARLQGPDLHRRIRLQQPQRGRHVRRGAGVRPGADPDPGAGHGAAVRAECWPGGQRKRRRRRRLERRQQRRHRRRGHRLCGGRGLAVSPARLPRDEEQRQRWGQGRPDADWSHEGERSRVRRDGRRVQELAARGGAGVTQPDCCCGHALHSPVGPQTAGRKRV